MHDQEFETWENHESEKLKMALTNIRQQPVPIASLEKTLAAAECIPMTMPAWRRGFVNALLVGVPVYLLLYVLGFLIVANFGTSKLVTIQGIGLGVSSIAFFCIMLKRQRQLQRAGNVLIDCGTTPGRNIFLLQIPIVLGMAIYMLFQGLQTMNILVAIGFVLFALFWFDMAFGRLQICEGGIRLHQYLLVWESIQSFEWKEGTTPTLLVQTNARFSWYSRGAYPIPEKFRAAVNKLLRQRLRPND